MMEGYNPETIIDLLDDEVYKGDLVSFETSGWSPKSRYLVREINPYEVYDTYDDSDAASPLILILGRRGGEYAFTYQTYPHIPYLNYLGEDSYGDRVTESRTELTRLQVYPAGEVEEENPDYLYDYFSDNHMVEAWPHV